MVGEGAGERMPGELCVGLRQQCSGVGRPEVLEIHHEERDVVRDVDIPQGIVELDAVEDARAVVETVDVGGLQVSVSITRKPGPRPMCEQVCPAGDEFLDQPPGSIQSFMIK